MLNCARKGGESSSPFFLSVDVLRICPAPHRSTRVTSCSHMKKDFDEKRREWRKKKKNLINAMSEMNARALKFECNERKTIALYAIQYYKVCRNCSGRVVETGGSYWCVVKFRSFKTWGLRFPPDVEPWGPVSLWLSGNVAEKTGIDTLLPMFL